MYAFPRNIPTPPVQKYVPVQGVFCLFACLYGTSSFILLRIPGSHCQRVDGTEPRFSRKIWILCAAWRRSPRLPESPEVVRYVSDCRLQAELWGPPMCRV